MKKIPIADVSAKQLAEYAASHLGIEINYRMGADAIRARMETVGFTGDTIEVPDAEAPAPVAALPAAADAPRRMVRIIIPNQNEPGGKEPVVVGVNGQVARIKRGVEVEVPEEYVHALTNANKVQFEKGPNGEPINPTMVPTHPFSIIRSAA